MWFKNVKIYKFTSPFSLSSDSLQSMLESMRFKPCSSQDLSSMGWDSPFKHSEQLYHQHKEDFFFSLKKEQKLLPASVVNAELMNKVTEEEQKSGSPMSKKAQKELKEEIVQRLLPRAFSRYSNVNGFISIDKQLAIVDASSDANAEAFLACLRKSISSLPVVPLVKSQQQHVLTSWLTGACPSEIEILDEAELQSSADDGGIIRVKHQSLDDDEITAHIDAGKLVNKLAISFDDSVRGILHDDCSIKRLKFSDTLLEQTDDIDKTDVAQKFDADFALFSASIKSFIDVLQDNFGEAKD